MVAFFEVVLRLQNAQILPLDSWKADHLIQLQELYKGGHSSATSSMVASQLVLRISKDECIN